MVKNAEVEVCVDITFLHSTALESDMAFEMQLLTCAWFCDSLTRYSIRDAAAAIDGAATARRD
jgi:hypothetical protein